MKVSARRTPSGVKATLIPKRSAYYPSQPVGTHRAVRATCYGGGHREGQVDGCVEKASERESVSHQNPCDEGPEHGVDERGEGGCAEG